jgi:hypothetical protein
MLEQWDANYPDCPPVGFLLRETFPQRWTRFHCLPESKRYAANEAEHEVIRSRYRAVLEELAQGEMRLWLAITEYADTPEPRRSRSLLAKLVPVAEFWRTVPMDEDSYWHLFVTKISPQDAVIDALLRRIAEDEERNVLLFPKDCRWVFYPYDGGMDVILPTPEERLRLRQKFSAWLPQNPEGL